jgi:hypothetical protein
MSAAMHQKAIRILAFIREINPTRVDAELADHERQCATETEQEAASDPGCPPCKYGWQCRQGSGCPARDPLNH